LARKIISPSTPVRARVVNKGDLFKPSNLKVHIKAVRAQNPDVNKILACVDSEDLPIVETQKRVAELEVQLKSMLPGLMIKYVVVDHALEGWLLCDREAVCEFFKVKKLNLNYKNPENYNNPVNLMGQIFRKHSVYGYIKTKDAPRLAEKADPVNILKLSPTFRIFYQCLSDP
jgi:hypothetical protein